MHEHAGAASDRALVVSRPAKPPLDYERPSTFLGSPRANDACRASHFPLTLTIISGRGRITTPPNTLCYSRRALRTLRCGSAKNMHDWGQTPQLPTVAALCAVGGRHG